VFPLDDQSRRGEGRNHFVKWVKDENIIDIPPIKARRCMSKILLFKEGHVEICEDRGAV
jgi:hypothetical protein